MKSQASGHGSFLLKMQYPRPSARSLSIFAMALWVASMALTGIVLYAKQQRISGAEILATGWLSTLIGNFAWFANPFFIWSFFRLNSGKPAIGFALLAAVLSLDTFRFSYYVLNEGGATTPVYGYGWGVALWFAALFVMVAAVGTRQIETRLDAKRAEGTDEWLRMIGFALCFSMLIAGVYLAIQDRKYANSLERKRLASLFFKRGPVCGADEPSVARPLELGRDLGPVEVRVSKGISRGIPSPFYSPTILLKWGIPVVRIADRDFSYAAMENGKILTSVPASVTAAAVLHVEDLLVEGRRQINAKLVEQATGQVIFDQVWRAEAGDARYCPDYFSFPKEGEQPRKLMTDALALLSPPADVHEKAVLPRELVSNHINAVVVNNIDPLRLSEQRDRTPIRSANGKGNTADARRHWIGNRNCPKSVGWSGLGSSGQVNLDTGWPFMVGDKAFYPGEQKHYNALCAGAYAYLFFGFVDGGKYYLNLQKRNILDFRLVWYGTVVIQDQHLATRDDVLKIDTLDESLDGLTISLENEQTGRIAVIKAPPFQQLR